MRRIFLQQKKQVRKFCLHSRKLQLMYLASSSWTQSLYICLQTLLLWLHFALIKSYLFFCKEKLLLQVILVADWFSPYKGKNVSDAIIVWSSLQNNFKCLKRTGNRYCFILPKRKVFLRLNLLICRSLIMR